MDEQDWFRLQASAVATVVCAEAAALMHSCVDMSWSSFLGLCFWGAGLFLVVMAVLTGHELTRQL